MPKMELILIRHGETDWNAGGVFRGHEDVRLNATGIAQADATAEALKDKVFEGVYSSPLKRSMVTAVRIAKPHEIKVRESLGLLDINFGVWQGRKESEVKERWPKAYDVWMENPGKARFQGGESAKKAWKRITKELVKIVLNHGTGTVVIVSHRVPLKMMTAYLLGKTRDDIHSVRHDPCAMSVFEVEGRTTEPKILNDSSHLARLNLPPQKDF